MNQAAAMTRQSPVGANPQQALHRARKQIDAGKYPEAEQACRQVLASDPQNYEALNLLGVVALRARLFPQAAELISRSLEIQPDYPQALNNLGSVMLAMGKPEQAEKLFDVSLKYKPDYPQAMTNLGALLNTMGRFDEAEPLLKKAVKKAPRSAETHNNLGNAMQGLGRLQEALGEYQKAIRLDPANAICAASAGTLKTLLGAHREAVNLFEHAIDMDPLCVQALYGLSSAKKITADDREVALFEKAHADFNRMPFKDQIDFLFAYGKVLQDLGNYEKAFDCLERANAMRRRLRPYRRQQRLAMAERIREIYQPELLEKHSGEGLETEQPVFILGMPRSGTTLTEQVLSSHPDVYGAGELTLFNTLTNRDQGVRTADDLAQLADKLDATLLRDIGQAYIDGVIAEQPEAKGARRFTDKLPGNFWNVGMIKLVFPNAKVIHVRRNPVDTCLSCFQINFAHGHSYTNNLADLGEYYGLYREMMAHWREVLPGFMLDIDYEDLVSDPEQTTRRMVEFVGLEWNDACLDPTKNRRVVKTASHWQVRQAVHTGSVERWRRYEKQLQPLLDALRARGVDID